MNKTKILFFILLYYLLPMPYASAASNDADSLNDNEIIYCLGDADGSYGIGKESIYEVAIHLTSDQLSGKEIQGLRIPIKSAKGISQLKGWITKELTLGLVNNRYVTIPDIEEMEMNPKNGYVECRFATPYTITSEGVYAGYSFSVDDVTNYSANKTPIATTFGGTDEGFYIHNSKSSSFREWTNFCKAYQYSSSLALQVILSGGDLVNAAAELVSVDKGYTKVGDTGTVTAIINNHGLKGIANINYHYKVNGTEGDGYAELDQHIGSYWGRSEHVELTIPAIGNVGDYPITWQITKVNGEDNKDTNPTTNNSIVKVCSWLPKHHTVIEEYTGTWCAYCPRGLIGMRIMKALHPDEFIGLSYHVASTSYEPMNITNEFPNEVTDFPTCWIDRTIQADPFFGSSAGNVFGIDTLWKIQQKILPPADISMQATYNSHTRTIDISGNTKFLENYSDHSWQLSFVITADSLCGDSYDWYQNNAYAGETGWPSEMDEFVNGKQRMNIAYDEVVVARSCVSGLRNSLPNIILADKDNPFTYQFKIDSIVNSRGNSLVQNVTKLNAIVLLIDSTTGKIFNAYQTPVATTNGIASVKKEDPCQTYIYDLQGRRVNNPTHGIYIRNGRKFVVR